jgi:hypothetical protein
MIRASAVRQIDMQLRIMGWSSLVLLPVVFAAVGLMFLFPATSRPENAFLVGRTDDFARASVTYFKGQHFFLVRLQSGDFLALYDLDPRNQQDARSGQRHLNCRLTWYDSKFAQLYVEPPPPGFESGGTFREGCFDSTFAVTGQRLFGPAAGLDSFNVTVRSDRVTVDLSRRECGPRSDGIKWVCQRYFSP